MRVSVWAAAAAVRQIEQPNPARVPCSVQRHPALFCRFPRHPARLQCHYSNVQSTDHRKTKMPARETPSPALGASFRAPPRCTATGPSTTRHGVAASTYRFCSSSSTGVRGSWARFHTLARLGRILEGANGPLPQSPLVAMPIIGWGSLSRVTG